VTGLAPGLTYDLTVTATNGVFTSPESAVATASIPATTPGPPTGVGGVAGDGQVFVSWSAPDSDGGSPVTSYVVTPYSVVDQALSATSPVDPPLGCTLIEPFTAPLTCTVTGLTNGTAYTFTVAAANAIGTGTTSAPSGQVTPQAGQVTPQAAILDTPVNFIYQPTTSLYPLITVPAPDPPAESTEGVDGTLSYTGVNVDDILTLAGLLLAGGAATLIAGRRRRAHR